MSVVCDSSGLRPNLIQKLELAGWTFRSDPETTAEIYARIDTGGCVRCGCDGCLNFETARHLVYPTDLIDLFEWLGVDPLLESEVAYRDRIREGWHAYSIWFHLVGTIDSGPTDNVSISGAIESQYLAPALDGVKIAFSEDRRLAPEEFAELPLVELELSLSVPWICDIPEPV